MGRFQYGGQAVIEGVMMRGATCLAVAVRKQNGEIAVQKRPLSPVTARYGFLGLPGIRGVVALFESLILGIDALMYSANEFTGEDERLSPLEVAGTLALSIGAFIALFIVLPNVLVGPVQRHIGSPLVVNLIEGILRIVIFLLYIVLISKVKDIQRVFAYHGAEHKAIHTYEHGLELTVENARSFGTMHPRCGTAFLLIVMVVSVLLFSLLGRQTLLMRILTRVALLPVVSGISYEIIKAAGHERPSRFVRAMVAPGMWLQALTTREPSDDMVEVAFAALKAVIDEDGKASC